MSTFTYSPTIPNPPNDPADDVFTMQNNSASINGIIAVDHIGFNVTGGGRHAQVTFNANNVPTPPVSPPVLFTDLPTNHGGAPTNPGLFFYSGNSAQSSDQFTIASNGSVLLMGGIILKWGTVTYLAAGGTQGFSFISAFPNNAFSISIQSQSNNIKAFAQANITSAAGFQIISNAVIGFNVNYYYIAIGN